MRRFLRGIKRNVFVLGIVSMFNDISSHMIFSVLPFFLTGTVGLDKAMLGLIEGFAEAASNVAKLFAGVFSDAIGRHKPVVVAGYAISAATKPLFAFATSAPAALFLRAADRIGKGIRTSPRDAMIADSTPRRRLGAAFGIHQSLDTAGAVVGPVLALMLLPVLGYDFGKLFLLAFVPAAISLVVLVAFGREPSKMVAKERKVLRHKIHFNWNLLHPHLTPDFRRALAIASVFALGNFSFFFILLRLADFGIPPETTPAAYLVFNLIFAVSAAPLGSWSDKIGRRNVLLGGYALFTLVCIIAALGGSSSLAWVIVVLYGLFTAAVETMQRAFVVDVVEEKSRATAIGTYFGTVGLIALPASALAGMLWEAYGAWAPFAFGAIVSSVAFFMLLSWVNHSGGRRG